MDQVQSMRAFVRVVQSGTFTKAAASMGLPKPTITKLVQFLETRLRVRLLHRTTRRVTLTPEGSAYYERTLRLLEELDEIEASVTHERVQPAGRLRVDVATSVARVILIPALPQFHQRYPDVEVVMGITDRTVDLVEENVDCAVRGGPVLDESLVARHLGELQFVTVASPAYLARHGTPCHPRELEAKGHRAVTFFSARTGRPYPQRFVRGEERHELQLPGTLAVSDTSALLDAVLSGLGLAHLATFLAAQHVERGELVQLLPEWTRPTFPAHVVYPANRHLSAKVRVFVDWVVQVFAAHPHIRRPQPPLRAAA